MRYRHKTFRGVKALPLRWRITLVSFSLLTVLLIALGIVVSVTNERTLLQGQADVMHSQMRLVITTQGLSAIHTTLPGTPEVLSRDVALSLMATVRKIIGETNNIGVAIFALDGHVIASDPATDNVSIAGQRPQTDSGYILANNRQEQRVLVVSQLIGIPDEVLLEQMKQAKADGKNKDLAGFASHYSEAFLQLHIPTASIDASITTIRWVLVLGIMGGLIVAALLTLPLMSNALRPLVEMEKLSTLIAGGELTLRLAEPVTKDEIGRLASSFNSMVAQLEATFMRQKRFVSDVSHELRTPLTALGGSLEMLLLEADNGDVLAARLLMRGMYSEVERMQRLVADLLVLSRLDEGQVKPREEAVDIAKLVKEITAQAQQKAENLNICCDIAVPLPVIYGDGDQLRRVLLNVLENALKFTPNCGQLTFKVYQEDESMLAVQMCDTGIGIPADALPYVFDRFYRVDPSRTRLPARAGGSGLGLAIAQGLVRTHGGTIGITSTPGIGTTVTIQLPISSR